MKYCIHCLLCLLSVLSILPFQSLKAQSNARTFINGDFADPSIIKADGAYYAVGTSSEWAPHFPVYRSDDLQTWSLAGYVFDKAPEWTSGSFWAPEYYFNNGTYYIYYTARRKSDGISCIGVATSKYPDRGFKDRGIVVSFGKEAIDAFLYKDNGQLYITFKAYGLDKRPIEILGARLSADGLKLEGETFSLLKDTDKLGMEGQSILKHNDFYYLFYSAGNCCGTDCSYNVRVARSKSFKGPYEYYQQGPVLEADETWKCSGHGTFVKKDDGTYVYIYHAYNRQSTVFTGREGMLAALRWQPGAEWPSFVRQYAANSNGGNITASFKTSQAAKYWQWDFRNANPLVRQAKGKLQLSGTVKEGNQTGVVITVRPLSDHFDITTTVENNNEALKGLAFYGDADAAVGIGVAGDRAQFWMVKDNKRTVLNSNTISPDAPVQLKLSMHPDQTCTVFYRQAGADWQQLGDAPQNISFLPRWDRSPRPGLHFQGASTQQAVFSSFALENYY